MQKDCFLKQLEIQLTILMLWWWSVVEYISMLYAGKIWWWWLGCRWPPSIHPRHCGCWRDSKTYKSATWKKTSTYVRTPNPSLRRNWKFNLLSVNERFAIVKLNWSPIFKVDDLRVNKVGKRCQLVLQHFGQLGRVNKLWGSNSSRIFSTIKNCQSGKLFACYVQTFSKSNLIRPEDFSSVDKIVKGYFYFRSTQAKFFNKRSPNLQFLSFIWSALEFWHPFGCTRPSLSSTVTEYQFRPGSDCTTPPQERWHGTSLLPQSWNIQFLDLSINILACWPGNIHLKGDKSGCVEEVNNEGKIEIDRPNECPQDDQHPEKPGFFILRYTRCAIFTYR